MFPIWHFLIAFAVTAVLLLLDWAWWQLLLFFAAAFLIDVDHYLYFIHKQKSFNLFKAYNYFVNLNKALKQKKKRPELLMVFHTLEMLALLLALTAFFEAFFPLLLGFVIHYFFDALSFQTKEKRYKRAPSILLYLLRKKWQPKSH